MGGRCGPTASLPIGQFVWHDGFSSCHCQRWLAERLGPIWAHYLNQASRWSKEGRRGPKPRLHKSAGVWRGASFLLEPTTLAEGRMLENKRERLKTFLRKIDEKAVIRIKHFMKERWGNECASTSAICRRASSTGWMLMVSIAMFSPSFRELGCIYTSAIYWPNDWHK